MKVKTAEYGHWKSHCGIIFRTRTELYSHNKECLECIEWNSNKYKRSGETRKNEWNEEKSKKASEIQKKVWQSPELRKAQSEKAVFNNFWKYRTKNPIIYESKIAGKMKLDSKWELEVAKRLDELNVEWYRPRVRLPYLDSNGIEHGYFPDFYVKTFNCFIEVKSEFIASWQNSNNKCSYIKEHYKFVKWFETEEQCKTFVLQDLGCSFIPEKDEEDISYWIEESNKNKQKVLSKKELLKEERWEIIQKSNIDFSKFGWVKELSALFGICENKAGKYIRDNYPEFYKTCYKRK